MLLMVNELNGKKPTDISAAVLDSRRYRETRQVCRCYHSLEVLEMADVLISSDLRLTQKDLEKIASQSCWLLACFKSVNKSAMEECTNRLNNSLQTFQVRETASSIVIFNDFITGCEVYPRW